MLTYLRAVQAVMKKEKPLSKDERIFEFISEASRHVLEKQGFFGPKKLPNGE